MSRKAFDAYVVTPHDYLQHYAADIYPAGAYIRGADDKHNWHLADKDKTVLREKETYPARLVSADTGDVISDTLDMELASPGHQIHVLHCDQWKYAGYIKFIPERPLTGNELADR